MKTIMTIILIMGCYLSQAQDKIVKYYDSLWRSTTSDKAQFMTEFVKTDTLYQCTSYYLPSRKLQGRSTCTDTLFSKRIGTTYTYHENGKLKQLAIYPTNKKDSLARYYSYYPSGNLKDSSVYYLYGELVRSDGYYENGKVSATAYYDPATKKIVSAGYTEEGNPIPGFVYIRQASFPGGVSGWVKYLQGNLRYNKPARKGAPPGKYSVMVTFTVDKAGKITDIIAENDPGYGTKEEAVRVIHESPNWEPAIEMNQYTTYHARQLISFMVSDK